MTKGTREARMRARIEREMLENNQKPPKKQFSKGSKK